MNELLNENSIKINVLLLFRCFRLSQCFSHSLENVWWNFPGSTLKIQRNSIKISGTLILILIDCKSFQESLTQADKNIKRKSAEMFVENERAKRFL